MREIYENRAKTNYTKKGNRKGTDKKEKRRFTNKEKRALDKLGIGKHRFQNHR